MPYFDNQPALLSARCSVYDKEKGELKVEVQNFGLSASKPAEVEVILNGTSQGRAGVETLQPYETVNLALNPASASSAAKSKYEVIFFQNGVEIERNTFVK